MTPAVKDLLDLFKSVVSQLLIFSQNVLYACAMTHTTACFNCYPTKTGEIMSSLEKDMKLVSFQFEIFFIVRII